MQVEIECQHLKEEEGTSGHVGFQKGPSQRACKRWQPLFKLIPIVLSRLHVLPEQDIIAMQSPGQVLLELGDVELEFGLLRKVGEVGLGLL